MCLKLFKQICIEDQDLLDDMVDVWNFLDLVPRKFRHVLAFQFGKLKTSLERWDYFLKYYKDVMINEPKADTYK